MLPELAAKVIVAIRRKSVLVTEAQALFRYGRKLRADNIYDDLVKRIFKNLLHKADENHIVFAHRGTSDRKDALKKAIIRAQRNFAKTWGTSISKPTYVHSAFPADFVGLQIIDYYLWALQRLYEKGEDRFFLLLSNDYRLIMDLDDKRRKPYGEWYKDSNPLSLAKLQK